MPHSESLLVLGPLVELRDVPAADAAGADAHPPLGVLGSLEDALLHETLLSERLKMDGLQELFHRKIYSGFRPLVCNVLLRLLAKSWEVLLGQ